MAINPSGRAVLSATCAALALFVLPLQAEEATKAVVNTGYFGDVAIRGFDPVAYFTDGKPMEGDPAISYNWLGAEWHFASEDHRAKFMADPVAYAPQYGGLCSDGVAYGQMTFDIDPSAWRIIEGKLYLNYDANSATEFETTAGFVDKADENWPKLQASWN